eukprot:TRINITY_DN2861_c0_g2_i2.p1 TRINITY_DN2861_c0_g2~~TRINITY_DN2861_c0_g2_i2.p1  ORF type:complete len:375 (+),score=80.46 TRINITY_DN2861_c0_g2_i2:82-1206(+)
MEGHTVPIAIGGTENSLGVEQASGAFSLGGGSYLRSLELQETVNINYESIELKYAKPVRKERRTLGGAQEVKTVKTKLAEEMLRFFKTKTCYDAMLSSTQIVIVDINLPLRTAFVSALENKVPCGILWDPMTNTHAGMMTVTDYITILLRTRESGESIIELQNRSIRLWRDDERMQRDSRTNKKELIYIRLDKDLGEVLKALYTNRIKRIPVVSQAGEVISVLTYTTMLNVVLQKLHNLESDSDWMQLLSYGVKDLGIGCYDNNTPTCTLETKVHEVLSSLMQKKVHCLPIVDSQRRCLDVFTRSDVMFIEQDGTYDTELSLASAIATRPRHAVFAFSPDDTLCEVMRHLGSSGVCGCDIFNKFHNTGTRSCCC